MVGTVQFLGPVRTEVSALGVRWGALFTPHASAHNPPEALEVEEYAVSLDRM